jgi:hypothetical protein
MQCILSQNSTDVNKQENDNLLFHSYIYNTTTYNQGRNKCQLKGTAKAQTAHFLQHHKQQFLPLRSILSPTRSLKKTINIKIFALSQGQFISHKKRPNPKKYRIFPVSA